MSGQRRRERWSVITPGQECPTGEGTNKLVVRPMVTTFNNKARAERFAGNIKGSRISPSPTGRHRKGGCLVAIAVFVVFLGVLMILDGMT